MEVSYSLVTQFEPSRSLENVASELVSQTELARDGGFTNLIVPEHHVSEDNYLLNEAVIAHVAEHVGDMRLSTGMCLLPYHNPVRIAEFGATVDTLTGGGFRLGAALGYRDEEYDVFGVDRDEAVARFVEGLEVIERLWTQESVTYRGDVYEFEGIEINPKPVQEPRPPIVAGASNESSIRRAAHVADGWIGAHVPFDLARRQVADYRDEAADAGVDGHAGLAREVFVAETTEAAEEVVREPLMEKYSSYADWGQDDAIEGDDFDSPWEKLRHERFIVGSPAEVVAEIERYEEELGLDELWVRMQFPTIDVEETYASLELFVDEVLPELD